jgi:hypothetical protein
MHLPATSESAPASDPNAYYVDSLFRSDRPTPEAPDTVLEGEASRILTNALRRDQTPAADQQYLARLVAVRTGLSMPDAERRVNDVMLQVRSEVDAARRLAARVLLWTFLALLIGAFAASFAATIGGRQRDRVEQVA